MLKRNTSGLEKHAQKKREAAFKQTEEAIEKLLQQKQAVNFKTVAEKAGVSRTWLYKQSEIRAKIEKLKNQESRKSTKSQSLSSQPVNQSVASEEIAALKQRIKKLETENYALRNHLEVVYGMAEPELIKKIEVLQAENEELRKQLQQLNFLKDFEN